MPSKYKVILLWTICSTYLKSVTSRNEVVLVNRDVTDSYLVGKDGCRNNANVCSRSATCQPESGLCLCNESSPNFVNHVENSCSEYSCIKPIHIDKYIGNLICDLGPFQVIPYSHNDVVTEVKFSSRSEKILRYCSLSKQTKSKVKFPNSSKEMEMLWLNKSYVDLTVSGNTLFFKWKRSVPNLKGAIIQLHFVCRTAKNRTQKELGKITYEHLCLQAKVSGTWSEDTSKLPSVKSPTNIPTTSEVTPYTTTATLPTTSESSSITTITATTATPNDCFNTTRTITSGTTLKMSQDITTKTITSETIPKMNQVTTTTATTLEITSEMSQDIINKTGTSEITSEMNQESTTTKILGITAVMSPNTTTKTTTPRTISEMSPDTTTKTTTLKTTSEINQDNTKTATSKITSETSLETTTKTTSGITLEISPDTTSKTITSGITSEISRDTTTKTTATTTSRTTSKMRQDTITTPTTSTIRDLSVSDFITTPPRSPTTSIISVIKPSDEPDKSRPPREVPGGDGDINWTLIVVAVVVTVVIVMVLVCVVVLFKHRKKKQTNSRRGSVEARTGSTSMREIRDRSGDAQRLDLNEDVPNDTAETAVAEWNPTYSTPECQSVLVAVNPCYGVLDLKTKDVSKDSPSSDPAYDTRGVKQEQDNSQSDPGYESIVAVKEKDKTVENKKKQVNGVNSKSDTCGEHIAVKRDVGGAEKRNTNPDSKSDKKMEARNIKSGEDDSTNSCDKNSHKSRDVKKDQIDTKSSESTYAKPDKKRETSVVKGKESTNPDSYEEPGYEALDITKKENDGRNSDATYAKPNKKGSAGNIKTGENIDLDSYTEPGYETPDVAKKEIEGTTTDTTYAKPNKKRSAGSIKTGESIDTNFLEEPGYETPDLKKKEIDRSSSDTTYAKPDKKRSADNIKTGENIHPDSYEEPGYETPDTTKKEVQGTSSDVTYAKPDKKRKDVGRQDHSASDKSIKNGKENAGHSTSDIKRIEINGDLYALPDKSKNSEKADGLDKDENPPDMVRGSVNGSERQDQSGKATAEPKMEKYKEL